MCSKFKSSVSDIELRCDVNKRSGNNTEFSRGGINVYFVHGLFRMYVI